MTTLKFIDKLGDSFTRANGFNRLRSHSQISDIMIHHSGSNKLSYNQLKLLHTKTLHKWPTIGYHFYVTKDGSIIKTVPIIQVTNGCENSNTKVIHICFEGNYQYDDFDLDFDLVIYTIIKSLPSSVRIQRLLKHSDRKLTLCPGSQLSYLVDKWNSNNIGHTGLIWPEFQ